jgi:DNA-binding GntR family transcriptional regulator
VIENAPYIDQVYERLLDLISTGELKPGERIRQWVLAEHLGVSRQPISHALQLLKHQGLVKEAGKQGVQVTPLDFRYLADLYDVRALVEEKAAYLAAERVKTNQASGQEIQALQDALRDGQQAFQSGAPAALLARADYRFHVALYRLSGNQVIEQFMQGQWPHMLRSMLAVLDYGENKAVELAWQEHAGIASQVLSGDAIGASAGCKTHLQRARNHLLNRLEHFAADLT